MGAKPGEPFTVTEFLKPGIEEMCSILPPSLAKRILAVAERGAAGSTACIGAWRSTARRSPASCGSGCWRSCAAGARSTYRFERGAARDREPGSALIAEAAQLSAELALEVAECARLIKGYGDTHKRGSANLPPDRDPGHPARAGRAHPAAARASTRSPARAPRRSADPEGDALGALPGRARPAERARASRPNECSAAARRAPRWTLAASSG